MGVRGLQGTLGGPPGGPMMTSLVGTEPSRGKTSQWALPGGSGCRARGTLCWPQPEVQPRGTGTFPWRPQVRGQARVTAGPELPEIW